MTDPRIEAYAKLLVERCVDIQPGWEVVVQTQPLARPLVEEIARCIAGRGAHMLQRIAIDTAATVWVNEAPEALLENPSDIERFTADRADAWIIVQAPENTREGTAIAPDRQARVSAARMPLMRKRLNKETPWVGCQYPTPALAQDANMPLAQFEDFLFGACLLDWDAVGRDMRRLADRFDEANDVHITGEGTDIRLSLEGRHAEIDDGHANMPGGEFFYSPVEDATEGVVTFAEFPAVYLSNAVEGARLVYDRGRIVDASARVNEEFLIKILDVDPGARVLGELGIGCNPGITRHMRNTLFDEKIDGTIHMAVGAGFPFLGSTNTSGVHWDMVKDLRNGGTIALDGEVVQRDGRWLI